MTSSDHKHIIIMLRIIWIIYTYIYIYIYQCHGYLFAMLRCGILYLKHAVLNTRHLKRVILWYDAECIGSTIDAQKILVYK